MAENLANRYYLWQMLALGVRMMLVVSMAMWSPAWCCCAFRAVAGEAAEHEAASSCCAAQPVAGCCAGHEAKVCDRFCPDPGSPCTCHDRPDERVRLDTAAKTALPKLLIAWWHPTAALEWIVADSPVAAPNCVQWAHPPPTTLLQQHCLMLL